MKKTRQRFNKLKAKRQLPWGTTSYEEWNGMAASDEQPYDDKRISGTTEFDESVPGIRSK